MAKVFCKIRKGIPHKSDIANQYCLKELEEEKRFAASLEQEELQKSAGDARGQDRKQFIEISKELRNEKIKEFLERKRKQQLVEGSEELRLLDRQIGFAISFKQLKEQTKQQEEAERDRLQQKFEEERAYKKRVAEENKQFLELEQKERALKADHRKFLLSQIDEIQQNRKQSIEEVTADRERIQKVIDAFDAKEAAEEKRKSDKKIEIKRELDKIVENQKAIQIALQEEEKELLKRGKEFLAIKDQQQADREAAKKLRAQQLDALSIAFGERWKVELEEKVKRERILEDLLIKERKAIENAKYRQELMHRRIDSILHRREMLEDINIRRVRKIIEKEEEIENYKREAAEFTKLEDEIRQKEFKTKKVAQKDLRAELFDAMHFKMAQVSNKFVEKRKEEHQRIEVEAKRMEDLQRERLALLKKQPKEVLQYLPPSAISLAERIELGLK